MNKHLQFPVDIELKHYPGQEVLLISFRREALRDWCLGLCLLQAGLIDTLVVTEERKKMTVKISFGTNPQINRIARATLRQDISQVELTRNGRTICSIFSSRIIAMAQRRSVISIWKQSMAILGRRSSILHS